MKWPQKVYHFKVQDPFLRMFIARYEPLIDWGSRPSWDEKSINEAIQVLLDKLLFRLQPGHRDSIWIQRLNVERLRNDPHYRGLFDEMKSKAKSDEEVHRYLLDHFNKRKLDSYKSWVTTLAERLPFRLSPAFGYLVLRPLLAKTNAKIRALCPAIDEGALLYFFLLIKIGKIAGNFNLLELIARLQPNRELGALIDQEKGWILFDEFTEESIVPITHIGCKGRWCLRSPDMARIYLRQYSLLFLLVGNTPVACFKRSRPEGKALTVEFFANHPSLESTPFKDAIFWDIERKIAECFYFGKPIDLREFRNTVEEAIREESASRVESGFSEKVTNLFICNPFILAYLQEEKANSLLTNDQILESLTEFVATRDQRLSHLEGVRNKLGILCDNARKNRGGEGKPNLFFSKRLRQALSYESFEGFLQIIAQPEKFEKFPRHLQKNPLLAEAMVLGWEK